MNHLIRRQAQAEAGPHGPTGAQMRALRVLSRSEEPLRMSELAAALGIARRSATSVVDDLEVSALVERVEDHMATTSPCSARKLMYSRVRSSRISAVIASVSSSWKLMIS